MSDLKGLDYIPSAACLWQIMHFLSPSALTRCFGKDYEINDYEYKLLQKDL